MRTEGDALRSVRRLFGTLLPAPWDVRLVVEAGSAPQRPYALIEQNAEAASAGSANLQDVTVAYTANLYLPAPVDGSRSAADDAALALREQVWAAVKWGPNLRRPTTDRIPLFSYTPRIATQRVRVRGATAGTWRLRRGETGAPWTPAIAFNASASSVQTAIETILPARTMVRRRAGGVFDVFFIGTLAGTDPPLLVVDGAQLVTARPATVVKVLAGAPAPWRTDRDFLRVVSFEQTTIRDEDTPELVQVAVDLRCTFARGRPVPFDHMLLERLSATVGHGG